MFKLMTILLITAFVFALGCGKSTEQQPSTEEQPVAASAPEAAAPAPPVVEPVDGLLQDETKALESVYLTQARGEITADNAEAVLESLAKEIEADIAVE